MHPTKDQMKSLCEEATELLQSWPTREQFVIEFAGTPKSGKSTCIDIVDHFFRRIGYKTLAPSEGASKRTPQNLKEDLVAYNAWSATYALTQILESRIGADNHQLVLMDRGLFDAMAWFETLADDESESPTPVKLTATQCITIQSFLLIPQWRELTDMVFLFWTDPETALQRENEDKLIDRPGTAMNPQLLTRLNNAYTKIREEHSAKFNRLELVSTSPDTTARGTAYDVTTTILQKIKESRGKK